MPPFAPVRPRVPLCAGVVLRETGANDRVGVGKDAFERGRMSDAEAARAAMPRRRPREDAVRLGKEIYERDILPQVEAGHFGEYVAIDVETGDWAVADGERAAADRLRERRPQAVDVLMQRVGYRALRSFGAGSLRRTR